MKILITGALGFIGSITTYFLLENGFELILLDNLSNSSLETLDKFEQFTNFVFYPYDITEQDKMNEVFFKHNPEIVIHFAALKSVKKSFEKLFDYYQVNVFGTLVILNSMQKYGCSKIIYSSSACVYSGTSDESFIENSQIDIDKISNPYGKTKYMSEQILKDFSKDIQVVVLRYFNPVGTIEGFYKEPKEVENLIDVIMNSIKNKKSFQVFGIDYPTDDGSCVRDFIHVQDLAESHIQAMRWMIQNPNHSYEIFNIGTGVGVSVLELIKTFEKTHGIKLNYQITDKRDGDAAISFANCTKSRNILNWNSKLCIEDICQSLCRTLSTL